MNQLLIAGGTATAAALLLFPLLIKLSPALGLVDRPNQRKVHGRPVPAIGGLVLLSSICITTLLSGALRSLLGQYPIFFSALAVISLTGLLDDRFDLSPRLRLLIQVACAGAVAGSGIRIDSLQGFLGIHSLSIPFQYLLTIIVMVGVTNAFNLMDGIDGFAGSLSLINIGVLCVLCVLAGEASWLSFLLPLTGALAVFLRYNWRPAKVFLGDGGSLFMGFLMITLGMHLLQKTGHAGSHNAALFMVTITGMSMLYVLDALRVFYRRIKKGVSPFKADRTHLHHLLLRHRLGHAKTTRKLIGIHLGILAVSLVSAPFLSMHWVILLQVIWVFAFVHFVHFMTNFYRWYRFIRTMERTA
jgi:UDP-GlcNAc:undecaprenyl-phosphate GlcNAc-1-phosphate transferase